MNEEKADIQIIDNKITKDTVLFFDMDGTLVDTNLANTKLFEVSRPRSIALTNKSR